MTLLQKLKSYNNYELVLLFSFLLILIKGFGYLFIGLVYPLLIAILLLTPFIYGYFRPQFNFRKTIKYWSILVMCYGIIRILLNIMMYIDSSGVPSGAYYQFTIWYGLKSVLYVLLGLVLFLKRKSIFLMRTQELKSMSLIFKHNKFGLLK